MVDDARPVTITLPAGSLVPLAGSLILVNGEAFPPWPVRALSAIPFGRRVAYLFWHPSKRLVRVIERVSNGKFKVQEVRQQ